MVDGLDLSQLRHCIVKLTLLHQNYAFQHQLVDADQLSFNVVSAFDFKWTILGLLGLLIKDIQQFVDMFQGQFVLPENVVAVKLELEEKLDDLVVIVAVVFNDIL